MPDILAHLDRPVVDFDYFHFTDPLQRTQDVAAVLALTLLTRSSQDELQSIVEGDAAQEYTTSVGTGGSGWPMWCASQSHQRVILALHFAEYARYRYHKCYLALPEYRCLRALLEDLDDWGLQGQRQVCVQESQRRVEQTCREFEYHYAQVDPGFLFEYMKNTP